MNKELLWEMFRHTGKIEYYIKYKELYNEEDSSRKKI